MNRKTIIIRLTPEKLYFNGNDAIDLEQTNLPVQRIAALKFDSVYWRIALVRFDRQTGALTAEAVDYFPRKEDIELFDTQNPRFKINSICISNLRDDDTIADAVRYYHRRLARLLREPETGYSADYQEVKPSAVGRVIGAKTIFRTFHVYFKDSRFGAGHIFFEKYVEEIGKPVAFRIPNDFVLPEYDYIKSYFAKALGSKKFKAEAAISVSGEEIDATATSEIIDRIDEKLIDSVKTAHTIGLTQKRTFFNPDKSLFTSDDVFDGMNDEVAEGNVFRQSEEDILSFLMNQKNIRNRKQLEYLAGKQVVNEKLRFTLHPHFGFLFLLDGKTMRHYCWELLDSHATYVWSLNKDPEPLERQYRRIEIIINSIRNIGRDRYKSSYRVSHRDEDIVFSVISHKNIHSHFVEGFVGWRHKLNERII